MSAGINATALHKAALRGRAEVVQMLLAAGADPTMRTSQGDTAGDLAARVSTAHSRPHLRSALDARGWV